MTQKTTKRRTEVDSELSHRDGGARDGECSR